VTATDAAIQALATEVSALRHQVAALTERLTGTRPDATPPEPAPSEDARG
jgi:ubiquinone biosynthesis protein UbiJ